MQHFHSMPFGAEVTDDGVRFALWAPSADCVDLVLNDRRLEMPASGQGWFKLVVPDAKASDRYGFSIGGGDLVPDPASRFQSDDDDRRSTIVDPPAYDWQDGGWSGRSWDEVVLCEVHLGTVTPEGSYAALEDKLIHFKELGVTAIELMPVAETSGLRTWGYDGVLPFAPNNAYGEPAGLKQLVDKAHQLGLMVFLDVVYNHFGPTGNFLHAYAKTFFTERHKTPWGAAINFQAGSPGGEIVREFFIQNALYWLREFRIDGLRFDAVHAIIDESEAHFLDELARRIRESSPDRHIHLVLENEHNEAGRLERSGDGVAVAYDAQWNDDYHHCWHVLLTGETEGYYGDFSGDTVALLGRCLAEGFAYQGDYSPNLKRQRGESTRGLPPQSFVAFLQNHDQIGNRAEGDRLAALADPERLRLARAVLYLAPQIPMIFMGDEWGTTTPFQFFVNFERDPALEDSIRKGRAKEFETFKSFGDGGVAVPDPTSPETFKRSKIEWAQRTREPYVTTLSETRSLLGTRAEKVIPLMKSGFIEATYARQGRGGLTVDWRFEDGSIHFVANFADDILQQTIQDGADLLWMSDGLRSGASLTLSAWTGAIFATGRS